MKFLLKMSFLFSLSLFSQIRAMEIDQELKREESIQQPIITKVKFINATQSIILSGIQIGRARDVQILQPGMQWNENIHKEDVNRFKINIDALNYEVVISLEENMITAKILDEHSHRIAVSEIENEFLEYNITIRVSDMNSENKEHLLSILIEPAHHVPATLFKAVKKYNFPAIKSLAQRMSLLAQDEKGNTVLHHAVKMDWNDERTEHLVDLLLSINPQLLTIVNRKGETPLSLAPPQFREKIMELMPGNEA